VSEPSPEPSAEDLRQQATGLVAEMMGELVEFWGFKASMGRVWATLYLSVEPLPADQVAELTGLSAGAVSMALSELAQWGLVERVHVDGERRRYYQADTDVWEVIRRIVRERELRLVARAIEHFGRALVLLEAAREADPDNPEIDRVIQRVRGLLALAKTGYSLVEKLADVGAFTLGPIRGTLARYVGLRT
jgi:DNA-binding transcriptional regulator GbsR (MarR family)